VVPGAEEAGRRGVDLVVSLYYIGFWLGVAVLASVLFRSTATSALAVLALWIFLAFFVPLGAKVTADALAPAPSAVGSAADIDAMLRHEQVKQAVSYVSPIALYSDATSIVLDRLRKTTRSLVLVGPMERLSLSRFQNALPLDQSALVVARTWFCWSRSPSYASRCRTPRSCGRDPDDLIARSYPRGVSLDERAETIG